MELILNEIKQDVTHILSTYMNINLDDIKFIYSVCKLPDHVVNYDCYDDQGQLVIIDDTLSIYFTGNIDHSDIYNYKLQVGDVIQNKQYGKYKFIYYDKTSNRINFYIVPIISDINKTKCREVPNDILYEIIQYLSKYDIIRLIHYVEIPDEIFKYLLYKSSKLDVNVMKEVDPKLTYSDLYLGYYNYMHISEDNYFEFPNIMTCRYYCFKYNPILFKLIDKEIGIPTDNVKLICGYDNNWGTVLTGLKDLYYYIDAESGYNTNYFLRHLCWLSKSIDIIDICNYLYTIDKLKDLEIHLKSYFNEMVSSSNNARRIIKYLYNQGILDYDLIYLHNSFIDINLFIWYFGFEDKIDNYLKSTRIPEVTDNLYKLLFDVYTNIFDTYNNKLQDMYHNRYGEFCGINSIKLKDLEITKKDKLIDTSIIKDYTNIKLCIEFLQEYDEKWYLHQDKFHDIQERYKYVISLFET
jgi:hypothetical protein